MNAFEAGFLKTASEYGLTEQQAVHILKRALAHEEAHGLFKSLPDDSEDENPEELEDLKELMRQDFIDRHMSATRHQIQL
jgi:hypothetical protein